MKFLVTLFLTVLPFWLTASKKFDVAEEIKGLKTQTDSTEVLKKLIRICDYHNLNSVADGKKYINRIEKLVLACKSKLIKADAFHTLGLYYYITSKHQKSLDNYFKAARLYDELKNNAALSSVYTGIANTYYLMKNYKKNLVYQLRSLEVLGNSATDKNKARAYNNIGNSYLGLGNLDSAEVYINRSLEMYRKIKDEANMAINLANLANLWFEKGDAGKSLNYLLASTASYRKTKNTDGIALNMIYLGVLTDEKGNTDAAIQYIDTALALAKQLNNTLYQQEAYSYLAKFYVSKNDYKSAYQYQSLSISLHDSVLNQEHIKQTSDAEAKYQNEKKQREIEKLNQEKQIEQAEKERRTTLLYGLLAGAVLLVIIIIVVWRSYINNKKSKQLLEVQNKKIEIQRDELAHQKEIIAERNKDMVDSINYAKRIQSAILPDPNVFTSLLPCSFVLYRPKDIVSGDFYFIGSPVTNNQEKLVIFGVADCTGHGVPGAFLTVIGKTFVQLGLTEKTVNSCAEALDFISNGLNNVLEKTEEKNIRDGMDVAMCGINLSTLGLQFSGANNPAYIIRGSEVITLEADALAIGELTDKKHTNKHYQLQKNDCVYVFSDGFADQFGGPKGKKFKYSKFKELLVQINNLSMPQQGKILEEEFLKWKGDLEQVDDVTVIGVRI